ncbi:MAG: DnaJ like chaperone protein [Planctomycetota bacterium]|jgi:DnaJ like chaperone protein
MFDRSTLQYWLSRFVFGLVLLVAAGSGMIQRLLPIKDPLGLPSLGLGLLGFHLALTAVGPVTRLSNYRQRTRKTWGDAARNQFDRASLPRRIFYLLSAVAEADGPMGPPEREVVRQFLLERFDDPVQSHEIRSWEMQPLQVKDLIGLAARIATSLDEAELDTLFCWCALVAFADGKFRPDEHRALADVARGMDIAAGRARMLFHLARAQFLAGAGGQQRQDRQQQQEPGPRPVHARGDALAVLGLPVNASAEQIRRRHRELVRKFHPDAQPNLGPVAQKEATERFQAIQRAYEVLTSNQ